MHLDFRNPSMHLASRARVLKSLFKNLADVTKLTIVIRDRRNYVTASPRFF